jgi:hypothetical protein
MSISQNTNVNSDEDDVVEISDFENIFNKWIVGQSVGAILKASDNSYLRITGGASPYLEKAFNLPVGLYEISFRCRSYKNASTIGSVHAYENDPSTFNLTLDWETYSATFGANGKGHITIKWADADASMGVGIDDIVIKRVPETL